jgi:lyso-ornithine lipid O-acyltransferase
MTAWRKHPLRITIRLLWLGGELFLAALTYVLRCGFCSKETIQTSRAAWMQHCAQRLLKIFGTEVRVSGSFPENGLLVSNHLSYLDVLVLGSLHPAVFVAKRDVKSWPVFGWLASLAGTVFINRERRAHVGEITDEIQALLNAGVLVILFPEGTSSDGKTVLPFKSSLLEPAARQTHPLAVSLIQYELADGDVTEEVCYWRDMVFFPHVINLLGKRRVQAFVRFKQLPECRSDRKELARQLHAEILNLKGELAGRSVDA